MTDGGGPGAGPVGVMEKVCQACCGGEVPYVWAWL